MLTIYDVNECEYDIPDNIMDMWETNKLFDDEIIEFIITCDEYIIFCSSDADYYCNKDGEQHNNYGPSYIQYIPGNYKFIRYTINGKVHRIDGPAIIDEEQSFEQYFLDGEFYACTGEDLSLYNMVVFTQYKNNPNKS